MPLACVLISDITGSTQLYERESNQAALEQISLVLARMRQIIEDNNGKCVKSQGDDVLSFFDSPDTAFHAAWTMINESWPAEMSVHLGGYSGEILNHEDDIYGSAVNTAARLSSLAKPGEILFGDACFDNLEQTNRDKFLLIGELQLRGKNTATRVYSCSVFEMSEQTVLFSKPQSNRTSRTESADFRYLDRQWRIREGETLSIGRSGECDIVLALAWVSRQHAALAMRRGQLEYSDHSSTGSVLQTADGKEFTVHRRTTLLNGSGLIFIGSGAQADTSSAISFDTNDLSIRYTSK